MAEVDEFKDAVVATFYVDEADLASRDVGVEVQVISSYLSSWELSTIGRMEVDGSEIKPTYKYVFETAGEHTIKYLFKDKTTLPSGIFKNCVQLISINLSSDIKNISLYAFEGCTGLTSITIPESVTSIGAYAFKGCKGLKTVTIGNGVTSINDYAFAVCEGLTTLDLGIKVT